MKFPILNTTTFLVSALAVWFFPKIATLQETTKLIPPPSQLRYFNFGYRESLSDSLWLRVIQDMDACNEKRDITKGVTEKCEKGWTFQMIDLITDLTPRFRAPYTFGATTLSVLVEDPSGATVIFNKGLKQFPKDWSLEYRAAYHFLEEEKNLPRAAELLVEAGKNGAPNWVFALAGRLYTKAGQALLAKTVLEDQLAKMPPEEKMRKRLEERLADANAVLAKSNEAPKTSN